MAPVQNRNMVAKKRSQRMGCVPTALLWGCIIVAVFTMVSIFFKIERIEVVGNKEYLADELRKASGIERGKNLFLLNRYSAEKKVLSSMPYVSSVKVRAALPDTVYIDVVETIAAAYIEQDGFFWLIDPSGKILDKSIGKPDISIEIVGFLMKNPIPGEYVESDGEDNTKGNSLSAILKALNDGSMLKSVSKLDLSGTYDIKLRFLDRFDVLLGVPEELDYKLEFLIEIAYRLGPSKTGEIDMTQIIENGEVRVRAG